MNAFILDAIGNDWKKTGHCDLAITKESFLLILISGFVLQKNSPYTEDFSRG